MAEANGRGTGGSVSGAPPIWEVPPRPPWVTAINAVGGGLRRFGKRWPGTDPEAMMASARRRTGLADFGDGDFREGLAALVNAFDAADTATPFGRLAFREHCVGLLSNRLMIQRDLTRHPEILDVPIRRPLVITGLPRTGTTLLHRLMSEDPAGRTMQLWETFFPSPPPTAATYRTDPRIAWARRRVAVYHRLSPRIAAAHEFEADSPEEDNNLYSHDFVCGMLSFTFDAPDYARWLDKQDLRGVYRYVKTLLQLLMWKCPGEYWVLKSPAHLYGLDSLLATYPDACVVQTHRDPLEVIPSICSLAAAARLLAVDRVDRRALGAELTEALANGTERAITARASADPARFYDVAYKHLVADPVGVARDACRHFGYAFTPEYEARARRWLAENPQHKRGVHRYKLDDFGLDADTVNRHFAAYRAWLSAHVPGVVRAASPES